MWWRQAMFLVLSAVPRRWQRPRPASCPEDDPDVDVGAWTAADGAPATHIVRIEQSTTSYHPRSGYSRGSYTRSISLLVRVNFANAYEAHITKRYLAIGVVKQPVTRTRGVYDSDTRRQLAWCPWAVTMAGLGGLFICLPDTQAHSLVCLVLFQPFPPASVSSLVLLVTNQPTGWYYYTIMLYLNAFRMNGHSRKVHPEPAGTASSSSHVRIMTAVHSWLSHSACLKFRSWRQIRGSAAYQECYMVVFDGPPGDVFHRKSVAWAQTFSRVPRRNRGVIWDTPVHRILDLADGRIFTISMVSVWEMCSIVGRCCYRKQMAGGESELLRRAGEK
ncbi:hypothetical protein DFH08DRAFT_799975 [Mycena albidolilacea]|uniref:Uncharacterized protein n=1 Tax=Mycena albidolilacea TaxID=1033008 RepID=A0AAD7F1H4_9AGAR|nr:hypothetical protein DFH08DRAFT_799975 [Mycena albidolilacea]